MRGGVAHLDILRKHVATPTIPQRDRDRALCVILTHDVLVEFRNNLSTQGQSEKADLSPSAARRRGPATRDPPRAASSRHQRQTPRSPPQRKGPRNPTVSRLLVELRPDSKRTKRKATRGPGMPQRQRQAFAQRTFALRSAWWWLISTAATRVVTKLRELSRRRPGTQQQAAGSQSTCGTASHDRVSQWVRSV